jgi:hypothetical protein
VISALPTYIATGDTGEPHAALDLVQDLPLSDHVVHVLQKPRRDGAGITGVGVEGLDDLLDGDRGVADAPGVVVGRSADEGVAATSAMRSRLKRGARHD